MLAALLMAPGTAAAQQATSAPDGQLFQSQSADTQSDFKATFGACAEQEWVWQHSLTVDDADLLDGPAAADGQSLAAQDDDIQIMFVAWFGPRALDEWDAEHNALIAHKVLLGTVAPVPCPPAKSTPSAIGTVHLADALQAARDGDVGSAFNGFQAFKVIWNAARASLTQKSPSSAQSVQSAVDQVNALLGDPTAAPPPQSQYLPALQNLLRVVRAANSTVAGGGD